MQDLILYPKDEEKIKIEFNVLYANQKYLPKVNNDKNKEDVSTYDLNIELDEITESEFENGLSEFEKTNYMIAATSGLFSGILNVLWSKDYELENAQKWGKEKVEKFVCKVAATQGCKSENIQEAIRFLEMKFPIQADKYTNKFGGGLQHHLRDFSHHPSILGLISSILNQFGIGLGTNTTGEFNIVKIKDNEFVGKTYGEKIFNAFIMWSFHLISDMAGSSSSPGDGTGIPGVILSVLKEMSSLPVFKEINLKYKDDDISFSVFVSKLFNGTYLKNENGKPIKIDFRTELGSIVNQSKSILINECLVRALYSLRSLYKEISLKNINTIAELKNIDIKEVLPLKSKMLTRMLTISSGVFVLIDLSKATVKSRGIGAASFFLNINYVGICRFILACKADVCYIEEDVRKILYEKYFDNEKPIFNFKLLNLNEKQMQILYSLELEKIKYDLLKIKDEEEKKEKENWCKKWQDQILSNLNENEKYFIIDDNELYNELKSVFKNNNKFYLLVMELYLFKPYFMISVDDEKIKKFKLNSDYFRDIFKSKQECIDKEELEKIIKTYKYYNKNVLRNRTKKLIIGASATTTVTILTGGIGWFFAPQIAIAIAGQSVAGLSGAALTSASLAFVGGGSLAAGGLGVAGGTAILTGGGALIGLAGTSATTLATILNESSNINILDECSKLLTFSKLILLDKLKDSKSIKLLKDAIDKINLKLNEELKKHNDKNNIKKIKANVKYLMRCSKALDDMNR